MEITYCSTYTDLCRCAFYSIVHRREVFLRLAFPVLYGAFLLGRHFMQYGWLRFPMAAIVMVLVMSIVVAFIMQILILWRVLSPIARRRFTTKLAPDFFSDISLSKAKTIPWSAISEIRYNNGDVYFWQKAQDGNFVPRSAFENSEQAQTFYKTAKAYWETSKFGQPGILPLDDTVWPPPPRKG